MPGRLRLPLPFPLPHTIPCSDRRSLSTRRSVETGKYPNVRIRIPFHSRTVTAFTSV